MTNNAKNMSNGTSAWNKLSFFKSLVGLQMLSMQEKHVELINLAVKRQNQM